MTATDIRTLAKTTDNKLFPIQDEIHMLEDGIQNARNRLDSVQSHKMSTSQVAFYEEQIAKAQAKVDELNPLAEPLRAIYRAHYWNRFILVPAGHLHRGTGCSTLRWTTQRYLLPDFSGADESEVVDLAGERACTVCFPAAPVNRPSMLPVDVAAREAAAQERAEKAAKLAADTHKFMNDDRQPLKIGGERLKTVRAAENRVGWLVECAMSSMAYDFADEAHRLRLVGNAASDMREAFQVANAVEQRAAQFEEEKPAADLLEKKYTAKRKQYIKNGWDADRLPALEVLLELAAK